MTMRILTAAALIALAALPAAAQRQMRQCMEAAITTMTPAKVAPGGKATLTMTLKMKPHWHVYDADPGDKFSTPTTFTPAVAPGVTFGKPLFPKPTIFNKQRVHGGNVVIKVPVTIAKSAKPGMVKAGGGLRLQACDEKSCLPPFTLNLHAPLTIGK